MTIVVPAIDLLNGMVVRVEQGDLNRATVYSRDPVETARSFTEHGATIIHVVDLDAAVKSNPATNAGVIESLLSNLGRKVRFQVGGGVRNIDTARSLIEGGSSRVVISSLAYSSIDACLEMLRSFGADRIVLALDYDEKGIVRTSGWKNSQKEYAQDALVRFSTLGFRNFLLTSIGRDGMLRGPDLENLKFFRKTTSSRIIASGGVASREDVSELSGIGIDEVIVGKAFYEKKIPLSILGGLSA